MYRLSKRSFDLVVSLVGLVLLSPLLILIGVAIRLESKGSALFRQVRLGEDGLPFTMFKFRTMVSENDDSHHRSFMEQHVKGESTARNNDGGDNVFLLDDDRVTKVGRILRRSSLDELPNLANVATGSMSIVGPRPPIPYEVEHYDSEARGRLSVKPGMTGYAQIKGRGSLTFDDMVCFDLEYIKERSFWVDIKVVFATIPAVFAKRGV